MADSEKVSAVYNYLEKEFDSRSITESYEAGRKAHVFKIQSGNSRHTAVIRDDFFEKQDAQSIADTLERFLLAEHLRECDFPIVVTPTGLSD
ncbi:MAG: hypothetical protein AB9866_19170 [Syntrophobacteraceae bacterium]